MPLNQAPTNAPPRPAKAELTPKANNFVLTSGMPRACATSSSARMARQARPSRVGARRKTTSAVTITPSKKR